MKKLILLLLFIPFVFSILAGYNSGSFLYVFLGTLILGFIIKWVATSIKAISNKELEANDPELLDKLPKSFTRITHYLSYTVAGCIMIVQSSSFKF